MNIFKRPIITIKASGNNKYHTKAQALQDWEEGKYFQDCANKYALWTCRDRAYMYDTLQTKWIDVVLADGTKFAIQLSEGNH